MAHRSATRGWFRDVALRGIDFGPGRWHRRGIEGRPDVLLERVAALLYTRKYESTDRAALLSVLEPFPTTINDTYTLKPRNCLSCFILPSWRKKERKLRRARALVFAACARVERVAEESVADLARARYGRSRTA